jgi:hypothetical protein
MDFRFTTLGNSRYRESYTFVPLASDISSGRLNTSPELGTYTSALFTSSSTRVLVSRLDVTVTSPAVLCGSSSKWMSIFRLGFTLRCIQRLSLRT